VENFLVFSKVRKSLGITLAVGFLRPCGDDSVTDDSGNQAAGLNITSGARLIKVPVIRDSG
jgi:hypothetical protein